MKFGVVYLVTCSVTGKCYVGVTTRDVRIRWAAHLRADGGCQALHRAVRKYGKDAFSIQVIASALSVEGLLAAERSLIAQHGTLLPGGYNICDGGTFHVGLKRSEETRAKMRLARAGGQPRLGIPASAEAKEKHRAALLGRRHTEERKQAIRAGLQRWVAAHPS